MKRPLINTLLFGVFLSGTLTLSAQSVGKTTAKFTNCQVVVNYNLTAATPTNLTLWYSPDNGATWLLCDSVTGDLAGQTTGTGKTIIWDCYANNVRYGAMLFKVVAPKPAITGCTVNSSLPVGKLTFMCYNLGADPSYDTPAKQMAYTSPTGTGVTNSTVYGDLYQWGRPADGHEKRNSATTTTRATTDTPGHNRFIFSTSSPYDWRNLQNTALWGATKTANDPCPEGYRIPTQAEWASIYGTASGNTWTWNSAGTPGYKISPDGGSTFTLFLPATGNRFSNTGTLGLAGTYGVYWSSTVYGTSSFNLYFYSGNVGTDNYDYRASGFACRCVAEY